MAEDEESCRLAVKAAMDLIGEKCGVTLSSKTLEGKITVPPEVKKLREEYGNPLTTKEIKEMLERSPWLRGWTEAMCRISGITTEPELSACKMKWARRAFE